ncbi:MAG: DNA mismatch repair endonuclease MutL, partial [Gemmatimonadota bacterium]|nr:DNA mismatch repair endonuclease MutL [Gemmatimonadota bacterium]
MTPVIKLLDDKTKNLIAAGEVIERPASVVKELIENSLDSGSVNIQVELEAAGNRLIRVKDDGHGMEHEDAELAFLRHATSKIISADDLKNISTMGFRGEALPSIAAVSRFELETCTRESPCGTLVVNETGNTLEVSDIARAPGTTATVRNLFFNVPARRKFLKTDQTELRHIVRTVTAIAIAQIEISFRLIHEGRELFSAPACRSVAERVEDIFGIKRAGKLLPVLYERGEYMVGGLIAAPDSVTGARGTEQYMFLNRRPFQSRALVHAVRQGYQSTIPDSGRPSFFLFLTVNPQEVDINVHPAKLEVRFRDDGLVFSLVHRAVQEGLRQQGAVADFDGRAGGKLISMSRPAESSSGTPGRVRDNAATALKSRRKGGFQTSFLIPVELPTDRRGVGEAQSGSESGNKAVSAGSDGIFTQAQAAQDEKASRDPSEGKDPAGKTVLPSLWQLHERYIFVETKTGSVIIDQHAAHERILYEKIMAGITGGEVNRQRLLFPVTLQLSPEEHLAVTQFKGILEKSGFEVEEFSGRTVVVRSVPAMENLGSVEDYFRDLLRDLVREGQGSTGTRHQALARSLACRGAIKSGKKLSAREMNELVDQLFATELPYADVHGRNT